MKGKLIVLEGVDASGKGTQTKILIDRLKKKGFDVRTKSFPQYYDSFFGKIIGKYLNGDFGDPTEISPEVSALLYAGDRLEARDELIKWKAAGKIIVLDRYVPSSFGFNRAKIEKDEVKKEFGEWVDKLEYETNKMPKPDLVLFLDVPVNLSQQWIKSKESRKYINGKEKDGYESNNEFLKRVYNEYSHLCETRKNWIRIECTKDDKGLIVEEISKKILKEVEKIL